MQEEVSKKVQLQSAKRAVGELATFQTVVEAAQKDYIAAVARRRHIQEQLHEMEVQLDNSRQEEKAALAEFESHQAELLCYLLDSPLSG